MHKWISITAMLILFISFSNGKMAEGEALSPPNEADNETVTFPDLKVYAGNVCTENTTSTVLTHQTHLETSKGQTGNFEKILEREENNFMNSTFPNELLNGIPPLKVKRGEKIILVMSTADPSNDPSNALLLEPYEIEVKQINSDEKVNIEVTDDPISAHDQIIAPKESGNYHYSVVIHWNKSQLKASYIFDVTVR